MMIEEFSFYQQLPPKMQTDLVNLVFSDFIRQFDHFMGSWEVGFKNAFVVNLYTRNYKEYEIFVNAGHEIPMVILVFDGSVHMLSKEEFFFMILPTYGVFGDY